MTTYISVCKNTVLSNLKQGTNKPVIRVSRGKWGKPQRVHEYVGHGLVHVRYEPDSPMPWGARAWLEVES